MWEKKSRKTLFTLALDNWHPELCDLTFPLLKHYAKKLDAEFFVIKERKYPNMPPTYEKLQIYTLAQEMNNDWNIYIDADALVHPEMPDIFPYYTKDTVGHNGSDPATIRWRYDRFFHRDGRHISSCNWFTFASDWCIDLWHPLEDMSKDEVISRCTPTVEEELTGCDSVHLIDDFILSRNIAKYGLKFRTVMDTFKQIGMADTGFLWHQYTLTPEKKLEKMKEVLRHWRIL